MTEISITFAWVRSKTQTGQGLIRWGAHVAQVETPNIRLKLDKGQLNYSKSQGPLISKMIDNRQKGVVDGFWKLRVWPRISGHLVHGQFQKRGDNYDIWSPKPKGLPSPVCRWMVVVLPDSVEHGWESIRWTGYLSLNGWKCVNRDHLMCFRYWVQFFPQIWVLFLNLGT